MFREESRLFIPKQSFIQIISVKRDKIEPDYGVSGAVLNPRDPLSSFLSKSGELKVMEVSAALRSARARFILSPEQNPQANCEHTQQGG